MEEKGILFKNSTWIERFVSLDLLFLSQRLRTVQKDK